MASSRPDPDDWGQTHLVMALTSSPLVGRGAVPARSSTECDWQETTHGRREIGCEALTMRAVTRGPGIQVFGLAARTI